MKNEDREKLKEELKKELLKELKQVKYEKPNNWAIVKKDYEQKLKKFDYTKHWEFIRFDNELIKRDENVNASQAIINSIGTLLKAIYEATQLKEIQASYEDMQEFTEDIVKVLEKHKERFLNGR